MIDAISTVWAVLAALTISWTILVGMAALVDVLRELRETHGP